MTNLRIGLLTSSCAAVVLLKALPVLAKSTHSSSVVYEPLTIIGVIIGIAIILALMPAILPAEISKPLPWSSLAALLIPYSLFGWIVGAYNLPWFVFVIAGGLAGVVAAVVSLELGLVGAIALAIAAALAIVGTLSGTTIEVLAFVLVLAATLALLWTLVRSGTMGKLMAVAIALAIVITITLTLTGALVGFLALVEALGRDLVLAGTLARVLALGLAYSGVWLWAVGGARFRMETLGFDQVQIFWTLLLLSWTGLWLGWVVDTFLIPSFGVWLIQFVTT